MCGGCKVSVNENARFWGRVGRTQKRKMGLKFCFCWELGKRVCLFDR
jgi:hypothetical protein